MWVTRQTDSISVLCYFFLDVPHCHSQLQNTEWGEFTGTWEEVAVACFKVLFQNLQEASSRVVVSCMVYVLNCSIMSPVSFTFTVVFMTFIACILHWILLGWLNQGGWGGQNMQHAWRMVQVSMGFWWGGPMGRDHGEDLGVGGRITLRWSLGR